MNRVACRIALVMFVVAACGGEPNAPGVVAGPQFDLSDGAHGGNPHFFFLPPLVPAPDVDGVFDPNAEPTVEICELVGNACGAVVAVFGPADVTLSGEAYGVTWATGAAAGVHPDRVYRIRVLVGGVELGFRDVDPDAPADRRVTDAALYDFRNGRTIPIKFRIEVGASCAGIPFDDIRGECTTGRLEDGILVQIPETGTGVSIPPQNTLQGTIALIIEPCLDAEGADANLPVDLPLFGPCFEVRTIPELPGLLAPAATIFVCEGLDDVPHRVEELIRLHSTDALDGSEAVTALPNAPGLCPSELALEASMNDGPWLMRVARGVARQIRTVLAPEPLYATTALLDRGRGGLEVSFSFFQFALPSKMEILAGSGQTAAPGDAVQVDPAVLVTDLDNEPVAGATVHFDVITGNGSVTPASVVTGADGVARVDEWVIGDPGLNELRASGRGIADPVTNGPRPEFDPFVPVQMPDPRDEVPATLATGQVIFSANACAGVGSVDVDGVLEPIWDCAQIDESFLVFLFDDPRQVPVRFRALNDGEHLYVAVTAEAGEDVSPRALVRLEFDHDDDGMRDSGEDHVTARGGSQWPGDVLDAFIACGEDGCLIIPDTQTDTGTNDGVAAFRTDGPVWIWEFSHPLASGDAAHDFQLAPDDTVWFTASFLVDLLSGSVATAPTPLVRTPFVVLPSP